MRTRAGHVVSDACQINDFDHSALSLDHRELTFQMPVRSMTLTTRDSSGARACEFQMPVRSMTLTTSEHLYMVP